MTSSVSPFVLVVNGGYGVGKSTVLEHLGDRLAAAGRPFCLFDVDWFHRSWPVPADDPANVLTEAANLRAVWQNYQQQGPRQPVLSGVIAEVADRDRYQQVFGLSVRSVRLTATAATTRARLHGRYSAGQHGALVWHLERHEAIAARIAAADLDELVLDTDALDPAACAAAILDHLDPP